MIEYSDVRYLLAKTSVDDRSLNQGVLAKLRELLASQQGHRLRILELGGGAGTMLPRLSSWGIVNEAEYTLLDLDPVALQGARQHLAQVGEAQSLGDSRMNLRLASGQFDVHLVHADAFVHLQDPGRRYDMVLANAVLDLMDVEAALPKIFSGLVPGGIYYFSINFDGDTIFLPELELDEPVMALYHLSMDERTRDGLPAGDSKCGRHLLEQLPRAGASILAAGSSDWVVFPQQQRYVGDEAYFLHHIVNTIDLALNEHTALDQAQFSDWVKLRHAQVEQGQLIYIAHQIDVVGCAA